MSDNPYCRLVAGCQALLEQGRELAPPRRPFPPRPTPAPAAPRALIFAPHPDDETIVAALPLRLQRQTGFRIIDVAVTLGSRRERRCARLAELRQACDYLGFELLLPCAGGFEDIHPAAREAQPDRWREAVEVLAGLIDHQQPRMVFLPHIRDWHRTHIGTHLLVMEALARQPADFRCLVVETEFWAPLEAPNLLVESTAVEVAELMGALSLHTGEVARNPYHLRLPAWMMDNVRRGGELVGGQGAGVPEFTFATLYRLSRWWRGTLETMLTRGHLLAWDDSLEEMICTDG
ncbi:MAG: PIG-L family deacetylase [Candidatus Competibacteraceae bacterium]|nr:PIG-L family deacetylase [Candidatus Competibacteraceae bacterium]